MFVKGLIQCYARLYGVRIAQSENKVGPTGLLGLNFLKVLNEKLQKTIKDEETTRISGVLTS